MSAVAHQPTEKKVYEDGHTVDCSCGERGVLWAFPTGARLAFLNHVAREAAKSLGIDAEVSVELFNV